MRNNKGFTLVELAIVLMIIGVILGGVIKGTELVNSAKVKGVYRAYQAVEAGIMSYQDRFDALPGDDAAAAADRYSGRTAGDGDGTLDNGEVTTFWADLNHYNFYTNNGSPTHPFGGAISVLNTTDGNGTSHNWVTFANIDGKYATILDDRYDDGVANTGAIMDSAKAAATYTSGTNYTLAIQID